MAIFPSHAVLNTAITAPFPEDTEQVFFGLGCFWGAERKFWKLPGVYTTAVGYTAGATENPSYQEVCTGTTGHAEVVLVVYRPKEITFEALLKCFWESHNPTQGMRQGNDTGSQYRSGIYVEGDERLGQARASKQRYQELLAEKSLPEITTEISSMPTFYYAEEYHQQYLHKNPNGYCGLAGTGVQF
ncbi:MAG: peptide-methionine (S)-S-oxide reductase [Pseudohongiellaceae bacterium]|jgi:peptide-methionine (S)-S-oxide reductase